MKSENILAEVINHSQPVLFQSDTPTSEAKLSELSELSELTDDEKLALSGYEHKKENIRNIINGIVGISYSERKVYGTGAFIYGEGGMGKTAIVINHLQDNNIEYIKHPGKITAKALYETLADYPDQVHVIDDAENLFTNPDTSGLLRSAFHTIEGKDHFSKPLRLLNWEISKNNSSLTESSITSFNFTGSIIIISNKNLDTNRADFRAVIDRIPVYNFIITESEMLAKMKSICLNENEKYSLTEKECLEVMNYIVSKSKEYKILPTLRLLENGFHDFNQYKVKGSTQHWSDLILENRILKSSAYVDIKHEKRKYALDLLEKYQKKEMSKVDILEDWAINQMSIPYSPEKRNTIERNFDRYAKFK